jgi:hypothetical protein
MPRPSSQPAPVRRRFILFRMPILVLLTLGLLAAGGAWWQRGPLLTWCYLYELARAGDAERDFWAARVAGLGRAAVPGLLSCLGRPEPSACAGAEAALARMAERWGPDDPRWPELAGELADAFPRLSADGRQAALRLEAGWLAYPATVPAGVAHLLTQAARTDDAGTHARALDLVAVLLARPDRATWAGDCREVIQACLGDREATTRLRAVPLALRPDVGLLERVMLLLHDPVAEVRREAMFAARSAPEGVVKTENLLRWLHDPDEEVRRLCEAVLRGRHLSEEHLRIGRLLTDDRPATRLQVLSYLRADTDLEPGIWLRLLSVDAEPSVRVAAVRAAVADARVDLSDRLDQMVRSDPSPTVSRLARYYLSCQQQRKASALSSAGRPQ